MRVSAAHYLIRLLVVLGLSGSFRFSLQHNYPSALLYFHGKEWCHNCRDVLEISRLSEELLLGGAKNPTQKEMGKIVLRNKENCNEEEEEQ